VLGYNKETKEYKSIDREDNRNWSMLSKEQSREVRSRIIFTSMYRLVKTVN